MHSSIGLNVLDNAHSTLINVFTGHVKHTLFAIILDFDFRLTSGAGKPLLEGGDPRAPLYLCMRPCSHLRFDFKCEYDPQ